MHRLSVELVRQSPSPVIRFCAPLTKSNRIIAEQLFNVSFSCVWDELYAEEKTDVVEDIPLIKVIHDNRSHLDIDRLASCICSQYILYCLDFVGRRNGYV
jgi:hypothetical protein